MNPRHPILLCALLLLSCDRRFEFDRPLVSDFAACEERCVQWDQHCASGDWQDTLICVECNDDHACTDPSRPRCSVEHRCVECAVSKDCQRFGSGYECVSPDSRCAPTCSYTTNDDDGTCNQAGLHCGDLGVCGECEHDFECSGGRCLACGYCAQCRTNADCSGNTPVCDPVIHGCVECSDGRQCSSGCCNLETHQCF